MNQPKGREISNPSHFVAELLKKIGDEEGIEVTLEPTWRHAGRITREDGSVTYFRGAHFDLNGMGSMEIAVDKAYAAYFLEEAGYRVIPGKTFYSPEFSAAIKSTESFDAGYAYAKEILGFPVIVKPNSSTQGTLVCVAYDKATFMQAVRKIAQMDRVFLVQSLVGGHDYRVVVLDEEVISAYERLPLSVTGDGVCTIDELLDQKQQNYRNRGRDTVIKKDDFRIDVRLKKNKMNRHTILPEGEIFALLDNRNLSAGGTAIDVTNEIHDSYKNLAKKITRDMGLRYCGVDFMVEDDIRKPLDSSINNYHIIEINSAPGVDHYCDSGEPQKAIVTELYRKILRKLFSAKSSCG